MNTNSGLTVKAPRGRTSARLALWMLGLVVALFSVCVILTCMYIYLVPGVSLVVDKGSLVVHLLVVVLSVLGGIWALSRGRFGLATGLTTLSLVLAAYAVVYDGIVIGQPAATARESTWVTVIQVMLTAAFASCVLALIACVVGLARQRLHSAS